MRIEGKVQEFVPVVITLECQAELDAFTTVFNNVGGRSFRDVFGSTGAVVAALQGVGGVAKRLQPSSSLYLDYEEGQ